MYDFFSPTSSPCFRTTPTEKGVQRVRLARLAIKTHDLKGIPGISALVKPPAWILEAGTTPLNN